LSLTRGTVTSIAGALARISRLAVAVADDQAAAVPVPSGGMRKLLQDLWIKIF
jgi:hypothetical protein